MAKLPTAIDKRNMLYAPERAFDAVEVGDGFAEKGRVCEALDFYERIQDPKIREERVARIRSISRARGDAFLLSRIASRGLVVVSRDDWREAARAAEGSGLLRHALRAAIQAGEDALAAELRSRLGDAVPSALAAPGLAESPEQAKAGATTPGQKVEAVVAAGAAHVHEPGRGPPDPAPADSNQKTPS